MNANKNEGESYVRRQAKASSAGTTEGSGTSRGLFRRAFATPGASSRVSGSGAPSIRGVRASVVVVFALCAFAVNAAPAAAAEAVPHIGTVSEVMGGSARVTGEISGFSGAGTDAEFEYSTDQVNWIGAGPNGIPNGVVEPDPYPVETTIHGLKGSTKYFVRLMSSEFGPTYSSTLEFETLPVDPPTVLAVESPSSISGTIAEAKGEVERPTPGNPDPGFDLNCEFEYISDGQFVANEANSEPVFTGANQTPCTPSPVTAGDSPTVTARLTGLSPETTYHLRLTVSNAGGSDSKIAADTFTTGSIPKPTVTIDPVTIFTATTAHLSGTIDPGAAAPDDPGFEVYWRFECEPECLNQNADGGAGSFSDDGTKHSFQFDAEVEPNTAYTIRLVAENAGGAESASTTLQTGPVRPLVQTLPAFAIRGGTEALVGGSINPRNSATKYWIEYGRTNAYGEKVPVGPADAGSGGALKYVTQRLSGLTPSTVYHVRLVAENSVGEEAGGDQSFETAPSSEAIAQNCPNATLRVENDSTALPECRAYEQVSPVDKNGFNVGQLPPGQGEESYVASTDGSKITFISPGAFADSKSSFLGNPYIGARSQTGWEVHALAPSVPTVTLDNFRISWSTPDLRYVVLRTPFSYHVAPGDYPGSRNLYLVDTATRQFTTVSNGTLPPHDAAFEAIGGSVDGRTIYFQSEKPLLEGAPGTGTIWSLYEWHNGNLKLASVFPNGDPSPTGGVTESPSGHTFVSEDGSRFIWRVDGGQLYLRENGDTYEITPPGDGANNFLGATPDLKSIFFYARVALTPDAADDGLGKIYRFDADSKTTTLISPNAADGRSAQVVLGASPDGSYVYFRSQSQYLPGQGVRGRVGFPETNLYLWHDGEISFIATEANPPEDVLPVTKFRVSPDGKFVSFESSDRLTAYNNTDATPGPGGESRADAEVYIYDAVNGRLTCVSCNPNGEPPSGTAEGADAGSSFPRPWLQSRNPQMGVGDDGHIFFNSRDGLVPDDVNGVQDVYEWRDGVVHLISTGTGAEAASYAAASTSGDDVFFTTIQRLVSSDRDPLSDLYDARVGGGFAQPAERSPCEGIDTCHGGESRPGAEPDLGSPNAGAERKADSARLRLKRDLRRCGHKPKKQRARCRKAAKKRFKNASTGRAHR